MKMKIFFILSTFLVQVRSNPRETGNRHGKCFQFYPVLFTKHRRKEAFIKGDKEPPSDESLKCYFINFDMVLSVARI
jgi:hypothetical protein